MPYSSLECLVFTMGINTIVSRLDEYGLSVQVEHNFSELVELLSEQGSFVNPTYDPRYSDLTAQDFWVRITDSTEQTVAFSAERMIYSNDLAASIKQGKLWYRNGFHDVQQNAEINTLPFRASIAGKIGLSGSGYTRPEWRGKGLALCMTWLTRLMSFRDLGTTTSTGFVRKSLADSRIPKMSYGFSHVEPIIHGYFPPQRGDEHLYLCWIDRITMATQVLNLPVHKTNSMTLMPGDVEVLGVSRLH